MPPIASAAPVIQQSRVRGKRIFQKMKPSWLVCEKSVRACGESRIWPKSGLISRAKRLANKMKKRAQLFRDLNQEILDDLKMSNELLDGGGTDNTAKSRDLRKDFFQSDACNESLPDAAAAPGTGLRGIMATFTTGTGGKPSLRKQSADFNRNTGAITSDIRKQVDEKSSLKMKADLTTILGFIDTISKVDTKNIQPLIYMSEENNVLRDDKINHIVSQTDALKNAPQKDSDYFKVPTVLKK